MTSEEMTDLLDLYAADDLPEGLHRLVETHLADHPDDAENIRTLRSAVRKLQDSPDAHPDPWFTDRLLDRVLQDFSQEDVLLRRSINSPL